MTRAGESPVQRRQDDIAVREVADGIVLLDLASSTYFSMSAVGAFLWRRLQEPLTVDELVEATVQHFDVTVDQARPDILAFVTDLRQAGLVLFTDPT